jgi:hypothetical protein
LYPLIMVQRKQSLTKIQGNLNTNRTHFYESGSPLSTIVNPQSRPLTFNTPCLSQIELCNWSWGNFAPESIMAMTFADHRSRIPGNDQASNMHEHVWHAHAKRMFADVCLICLLSLKSLCHLTIFNRIFSRQSYQRLSLQRIHPRMVSVVKAPDCPRGQRRCPLRYPHHTADHSTSSIFFWESLTGEHAAMRRSRMHRASVRVPCFRGTACLVLKTSHGASWRAKNTSYQTVFNFELVLMIPCDLGHVDHVDHHKFEKPYITYTLHFELSI